MNEKAYNKMTSLQKHHTMLYGKQCRLSTLSKSCDQLENDLDYYTYPMTHEPYTGELNELGRRVEAEKKRRGLK